MYPVRFEVLFECVGWVCGERCGGGWEVVEECCVGLYLLKEFYNCGVGIRGGKFGDFGFGCEPFVCKFSNVFTSMSVGVEGVAPSGRFVVFRHFLICSTELLCVDSNIS